ncbi:Hypothetical protein MVR_LOCUS299 [uncultured virus]|nr:Hypothetical protein MVR_LOCUS299 [uncultured virus]
MSSQVNLLQHNPRIIWDPSTSNKLFNKSFIPDNYSQLITLQQEFPELLKINYTVVFDLNCNYDIKHCIGCGESLDNKFNVIDMCLTDNVNNKYPSTNELPIHHPKASINLRRSHYRYPRQSGNTPVLNEIIGYFGKTTHCTNDRAASEKYAANSINDFCYGKTTTAYAGSTLYPSSLVYAIYNTTIGRHATNRDRNCLVQGNCNYTGLNFDLILRFEIVLVPARLSSIDNCSIISFCVDGPNFNNSVLCRDYIKRYANDYNYLVNQNGEPTQVPTNGDTRYISDVTTANAAGVNTANANLANANSKTANTTTTNTNPANTSNPTTTVPSRNGQLQSSPPQPSPPSQTTGTTNSNNAWWRILLIIAGLIFLILLIWLIVHLLNKHKRKLHPTQPSNIINTASYTSPYEAELASLGTPNVGQAISNSNQLGSVPYGSSFPPPSTLY